MTVLRHPGTIAAMAIAAVVIWKSHPVRNVERCCVDMRESEYEVHKTTIHALAWHSCYDTRAQRVVRVYERVTSLLSWPLSTSYILEGVSYNGFLLFTKTEGLL